MIASAHIDPRERIAGGVADLGEDMIEAIRNVEPGPKSQDAEASLDSACTRRGHPTCTPTDVPA